MDKNPDRTTEVLEQTISCAIGIIASQQHLLGGGYEETLAFLIAAKHELRPPPKNRDREQLITDIYDLIPALPHRDLLYIKEMVVGHVKTNLEAQFPQKKNHDPSSTS